MRYFFILAALLASPFAVCGGTVWKSDIQSAPTGGNIVGFAPELRRADIDSVPCVSASGKMELLTIQGYIGAGHLGDFTLGFKVRPEDEKASFQVVLGKKHRDAKEGFQHYELTFTPARLIIREVPAEGVKTPPAAATYAFTLKPGEWGRVVIEIKEGFVFVTNDGRITEKSVKHPVGDSGSFAVINALGRNSYADFILTEKTSNIPSTLKKDASK